MKRAFIVTTFVGTLALDERNKVIGFRLLGDEREAAEKILRSASELIEEERELIEELKERGYSAVKGDKEREDFVKKNLFQIAKELKVAKNLSEFNSLVSKIGIEIAKLQIKKAVKKDDVVLHVNNAIEEIDKMINIFVERLRDWYSLHFPELERSIKDHEKFVKLVATHGGRKNFEDTEYDELARKSMGAEFRAEDIKAIQRFSQNILSLFNLRKNMAKYLESMLKALAPNMTEIAGTMLAAKLITRAGSLEKLAKMPSSKIQLMGSEKALFRYLRGKGRSPKHGLIFIHPYIQNAPKKLRGKIARALASKLSIAAKLDYFSKEYKADKLKEELKERVKEILSGGK